MKVCIISRGDLDLFPPTQGASVKIFYTLKTLSELGISIYFVSGENNFYYKVENGKFVKKKYPRLIAKSPINIFHKIVLSCLGIPNDIFVIYHPLVNIGLWVKLLYVSLKEKIDLIQAEFTAFGIPAIVVKLFTSKPVVLVEHNVESFQLPSVTKLTSLSEKIIKIVEKFVCRFSDRIVVMCKEENKKLMKLGIDKNKVYIIPHGVDLDSYKNVHSKKIRKKYKLRFPTLVFHGVYSYKPNYDAVKVISEKILPKLKKRGINPKLLAIGDFPPKDIKNPDVVFTGAVKKLPNYVGAADIAVIPLQAGGGIRMKILEYFAAKKPIISTKKGAEGIDVHNNQEIILCELERFPQKIFDLIKSDGLRTRITKNALDFVKDYDWKKICQKYVNMYRIFKK